MSAFQLHFADHSVSPGRRADRAGRDESAALKANLADLPNGGTIIVDTDEFTKRNLAKVGYAASPVEDGSLADYLVHPVKLTSLTVDAVAKVGVSRKDAERAKNMFALGLLSWLYHRPLEGTRRFLETKFAGRPEILRANLVALEAGWSYGETTEGFAVNFEVKPASLPPGRYRTIRGNQALALGLVAAGERRTCRCSWARTRSLPRRHPARAVGAQNTSVSGRSRPRTRSPVWRPRWRLLRRQPGRDDDVRTGHRAQGRDDRPGRRAGTPLIVVDVAARRAVDRPAHEDGAGRSVAGDVRPQR